MPAPILYIAGPITGVECYAERFDAADYALRQEGYETRNPTKCAPLRTSLEKAEPSWHDCMRQGIHALTGADGVALLDGWEDSRGASWEHRIATEVLAIPCLPVAEWLGLGGTMP